MLPLPESLLILLLLLPLLAFAAGLELGRRRYSPPSLIRYARRAPRLIPLEVDQIERAVRAATIFYPGLAGRLGVLVTADGRPTIAKRGTVEAGRVYELQVPGPGAPAAVVDLLSAQLAPELEGERRPWAGSPQLEGLIARAAGLVKGWPWRGGGERGGQARG